jgi:hypothetical protein
MSGLCGSVLRPPLSQVWQRILSPRSAVGLHLSSDRSIAPPPNFTLVQYSQLCTLKILFLRPDPSSQVATNQSLRHGLGGVCVRFSADTAGSTGSAERGQSAAFGRWAIARGAGRFVSIAGDELLAQSVVRPFRAVVRGRALQKASQHMHSCARSVRALTLPANGGSVKMPPNRVP